MSVYIPVFTSSVDCHVVSGGIPGYEDALGLIEDSPWMNTSRNYWYQGLLRDLLGAYHGFDELRYLTEVVAVVPYCELERKMRSVTSLMLTIKEVTGPFIKVARLDMVGADEIRKNIDEAEVLRAVYDDSIYAFDNFFTFLMSQRAAIEEALKKSKCILYVQAQP